MTFRKLMGMGSIAAFFILPTAVVAAQPETAASEPSANGTKGANGTNGTAGASATTKAEARDAAASSSVTTPQLPDAAAPAAPGSCRLGKHSGIDPDDAETAASLVCRELPREAASSGHAYRVDLDKLGTRIFVSLAAESKGQTIDSRRIGLERIEEVPTVAPRLTDSLIHGKSLQETEQIGNLSWAEAEAPARKRGRLLTSLGILGAAAPSLSTLSPGILGSVVYDTPRWALTAHGQLAFGVGNGEQFNLAALGVGPRYMLSAGNSSFFLGGGMAIESLGRVKQTRESFGYLVKDRRDNAGIAAYAEIGYEAMRLHRNRINVALRADFPLFEVDNQYLVPLTLSSSFVFDGF